MNGRKEKYLVAAQKLIERGQLDKALGEFAKVVEEDPSDTRTWLKMAELHARQGASARAAEIYLRTGELYVEQGFAQKAVAVYKNVLKLSPGQVSAHLKLGAVYADLGLGPDAVQQFELAAAALQRAGSAAEAVAALRRAIEVQPDNVVLRVKLAEAASLAGLVEEAVREFGRAADQLKAQGRVDESLRVAERLLFHQPENHAKARELAEAYIAKGSARLALPKLQACLNGDAGDPRTLSLLARALEQMGQAQKAVSVLKELVRVYEDLGRGSERDAAVLRALTLAPLDLELQELATRHQLRAGGRGDPGGSLAADATPPPLTAADAIAGGGSFDLSGVVRIVSTGVSGRIAIPAGAGDTSARVLASTEEPGRDADVERILAESDVFVKYGLFERAVDHLGRVFDIDPENRVARETLIRVLQKLGRRREAARHLEILARQQAEAQAGAGPARAARAAIVIDLEPDLDQALDMSSTPPPALDPGATPPPRRVEPESSEDNLDFEATVDTGDVVAVSRENSSGRLVVDWEEEGSDQVTPPPVSVGPARPADRTRTPKVVALTRKSSGAAAMAVIGLHEDRDDDEEDPAGAFDEEVPTVASSFLGDLPGLVPAPSWASSIDEDDLSAEFEQVTFFVEQSLPEEAEALLQDLEKRFPGHPRVAAKRRELRLAEARAAAVGSTVIEGMSSAIDVTPAPRAVVEGGGVVDPSTHADLGIAYKEMGLFDAAIAELKLLTQDPTREVFALTTMGECFEAKGSFTEAVIRYKRALNCTPIAAEEITALYFLLGGAFDRLGDVSEALFFFEKVARRDPRFRDVDQKIAALKPRLVKKAR